MAIRADVLGRTRAELRRRVRSRDCGSRPARGLGGAVDAHLEVGAHAFGPFRDGVPIRARLHARERCNEAGKTSRTRRRTSPLRCAAREGRPAAELEFERRYRPWEGGREGQLTSSSRTAFESKDQDLDDKAQCRRSLPWRRDLTSRIENEGTPMLPVPGTGSQLLPGDGLRATDPALRCARPGGAARAPAARHRYVGQRATAAEAWNASKILKEQIGTRTATAPSVCAAACALGGSQPERGTRALPTHGVPHAVGARRRIGAHLGGCSARSRRDPRVVDVDGRWSAAAGRRARPRAGTPPRHRSPCRASGRRRTYCRGRTRAACFETRPAALASRAGLRGSAPRAGNARRRSRHRAKSGNGGCRESFPVRDSEGIRSGFDLWRPSAPGSKGSGRTHRVEVAGNRDERRNRRRLDRRRLGCWSYNPLPTSSKP